MEDSGTQKNHTVKMRLFKLITEMSEQQQVALLKQIEEMKSTGKRKHTRRECEIDVYYATDERTFKDSIKNISATGAYIETEEALYMGQRILLHFSLPSGQPGKVLGEIVRNDENGFAVKFKRKRKIKGTEK